MTTPELLELEASFDLAFNSIRDELRRRSLPQQWINEASRCHVKLSAMIVDMINDPLTQPLTTEPKNP